MRESRRRGFSLIESVATLTIMSLIAVGLISLAGSVLNQRQRQLATDGLHDLRRAINGNPTIVINEGRTSFGYIGDMGGLPNKLEDLWVKGSQPSFVFNNTKKAGAGWNGPYLEVHPAGFAAALASDSWGTPFSYTRMTETDAIFGAAVLGRILSLGPDQTAGGGDDISLNLFQSELASRVQGYVRDANGNGMAGVGVTINYPQNGLLNQQTKQSDSVGYYFFSDLSFGNRSVTIEPRLVVAPDSAVVSGGANENVEFVIKNFSANDLTISSITIAYDIDPPAFFKQLRIGDGPMGVVYDSTNPRLGNGSSKTFTAKVIAGTGLIGESIPIRIQSAVTDVADLVIGNIGRGGSLRIQLNDFQDVQTGNGNKVDMTGVIFQITFSDESTVVFAPIQRMP